MGLAPWSVWVAGGLALLLGELALPGVLLVWIGLAATGAGLLTAAAGLGPAAQVAAFTVLAALAVWLGLRLRAPHVRAINTPQSGLVGRRATVLHFTGREGRVRVGDADWAARLHDPDTPIAGEMLRVVGVDGMVLVVAAEDAQAGRKSGTDK